MYCIPDDHRPPEVTPMSEFKGAQVRLVGPSDERHAYVEINGHRIDGMQISSPVVVGSKFGRMAIVTLTFVADSLTIEGSTLGIVFEPTGDPNC